MVRPCGRPFPRLFRELADGRLVSSTSEEILASIYLVIRKGVYLWKRNVRVPWNRVYPSSRSICGHMSWQANASVRISCVGCVSFWRCLSICRYTEKAYLEWSRHFALYVHGRPVSTLGETEVRRFLTHLAMDRQVAASTQNQAFCAL